MSLASSFEALLSGFSPLLTGPSFQNLLVIAQGWLFCLGRRTITQVIQAGGGVYQKHHSAFHRFFSRAEWCVDEAGRILLTLVLKWVPEDTPVFLAVDDTLCRKRGLQVFGTCMHHDPLISCRNFRLVSWGHNWVVVGVLLRFPFAPSVTWCLPFAFRLYISRKRARSQRWKCGKRRHQTRPELAVEIFQKVFQWFPERSFHVIGDTAYGGASVSKHLPSNFHLTSRIHMEAELYGDPEPQKGRGRPRKRGQRLPTPAALARRSGGWKTMNLEIYGKRKTVHVKKTSGRWKRAGYRQVNVVIVRDPKGKTSVQAFYTTDLECGLETLLVDYADRWSIEVAFQNAKSHFGFEDPQNWTRKAVERTAPMAMILYSLVILWFAETGYRKFTVPERPWYRKKSTPSFVDMLHTLRKESLREYFLNVPEWNRGSRKTLRLFTELLRLAA